MKKVNFSKKNFFNNFKDKDLLARSEKEALIFKVFFLAIKELFLRIFLKPGNWILNKYFFKDLKDIGFFCTIRDRNLEFLRIFFQRFSEI